MEICPEAPGGGGLTSKTSWGKNEKRGEIFLCHFSGGVGGGGGGGGQMTFRGGKSMLAAMIC